MNDNKKTAVSWLIKKLQNRQNGIFNGLPHLSLDEIYSKALQIEREQIEEAYYEGKENNPPRLDWEYYDQTYGKP